MVRQVYVVDVAYNDLNRHISFVYIFVLLFHVMAMLDRHVIGSFEHLVDSLVDERLSIRNELSIKI